MPQPLSTNDEGSRELLGHALAIAAIAPAVSALLPRISPSHGFLLRLTLTTLSILCGLVAAIASAVSLVLLMEGCKHNLRDGPALTTVATWALAIALGLWLIVSVFLAAIPFIQ